MIDLFALFPMSPDNQSSTIPKNISPTVYLVGLSATLLRRYHDHPS